MINDLCLLNGYIIHIIVFPFRSVQMDRNVTENGYRDL